METAKVIDWNPPWSTGAPMPHIFSDGRKLYLIYYMQGDELALVTFNHAGSHRFGIVNDEAINGHPLYDKGLEIYRAHIIENSSWIEELKQIHKVHPRYSEDHWKNKVHYLLFFHDEILEVIASGGYTIETFQTTMRSLIAEVANRMASNSF